MTVLDVMYNAYPDPIAMMLQKGLRIEKYCGYPAFTVELEFDSITNVITRLWWEENRVFLDTKSEIKDLDNKIFCMRISLGEALDYIYTVTPPLLQSEIPNSIKDVKSIYEVLRTYLMEPHGGTELYYRSKFQEMMMLDREQNVSTLNADTFLRVYTIRNKAGDDGVITYMLYGKRSPLDIIGSTDKCGIYIFHAWNRGDIFKLFQTLIKYAGGYHILDYDHSSNHGHYITISLDHINSEDEKPGDVEASRELDVIITRSYGWMKQQYDPK